MAVLLEAAAAAAGHAHRAGGGHLAIDVAVEFKHLTAELLGHDGPLGETRRGAVRLRTGKRRGEGSAYLARMAAVSVSISFGMRSRRARRLSRLRSKRS